MLRSRAASKPSNTLREYSVPCAEPALKNIAWNGGHAIRPNSTETEIHEWSLFRFRNSYDPGLDGTDVVLLEPEIPPCTRAARLDPQVMQSSHYVNLDHSMHPCLSLSHASQLDTSLS